MVTFMVDWSPNFLKHLLEILVAIIPGAFSLLSLAISIFSNFWIVKIKKENNKELEEMKQSFQQEIEKLKSELEKERMEFNHQLELEKIKGSGIYQKRMEAIIVINSKIIDVYRSLKIYVSIKRDCTYREDYEKRIDEFLKEFWKEYNSVRILIPEKVDKKITDLIDKIKKKCLSFMSDVEDSMNYNEKVIKWDRINAEVSELWDTMLLEIREEFRKILGVNQE